MSNGRLLNIAAFVGVLTIGVTSGGFLTMGYYSGTALAGDDSQVFGNWSGESKCQVKDSPCRDEKVVYRLSPSEQPCKITVSADKIVDGRPVKMGSIEFDYDQRTGMLTSASSSGLWKFRVHGKTMEGTLTLPGNTIYRRVTLRKSD